MIVNGCATACVCLSKNDKEINQQTNYVGGPDKKTN